jgi:hypothetical protein
MGGLRRHKGVLGWIAIIALLCNAFATAALARSPAASLVDDVLGPLVICTADGAKEAPGHGSPGRHVPSDHCPACITVKPLALAIVIAPTALDFPLARVAKPVHLQPRSPAVHVSLGGIRSRAPPLFA